MVIGVVHVVAVKIRVVSTSVKHGASVIVTILWFGGTSYVLFNAIPSTG